MAFYTRAALQGVYAQRGYETKGMSASAVLRESVKASSLLSSYDIFLSHSSLDAIEVYALKRDIETRGFTVYVDWIDDLHQLDRSSITPETARTLKERMGRCKGLLYAAFDHATTSKWMPWETGYFDALKKRVSIVPILERDSGDDSYKGQEYLGLYPYVVKTGENLYVHNDATKYARMRWWLDQADALPPK